MALVIRTVAEIVAALRVEASPNQAAVTEKITANRGTFVCMMRRI